MKMQTNREPTAKRKPMKNSKKPEVAKVGRLLGGEAEQQQKKDRLANITYLRDKGNEPLPDDPMLDGWKRERTIMRALLRGEVLPTKNHCMSGVADYEKLLSEWIEEAESHRRVEAKKRADSARLAHLLEVRDHLFIALELIHKYHPNPYAKKRIESETARIKSEHMAWENTISKVARRNMYCRGEYYAALADRTAKICKAYATLLNEFYGEDPALIKNHIEVVVVDFVGKAKERMDATQSAAERAADNTAKIIRLIRELKPGWLTGKEKPPRKYLQIAGTVKMKIYELWGACKAHPQQYGAKPDPGYADFLSCCGGCEIHPGLTLDSFIHEQAAKANTTDLELVAKIIRGMNQNRRNANAKTKQKPKSGQNAKRK